MQESTKQTYTEPTLEKREELILVTAGGATTIGNGMMVNPGT
jgi:hypothetical protein